jgi:hypothetical protein
MLAVNDADSKPVSNDGLDLRPCNNDSGIAIQVQRQKAAESWQENGRFVAGSNRNRPMLMTIFSERRMLSLQFGDGRLIRASANALRVQLLRGST